MPYGYRTRLNQPNPNKPYLYRPPSRYRASHPIARFMPTLRLSTALMLGTLGGVSCSSVSINERAVHQTIEKQRGNVVTQNQLSRRTTSRLLSAGIEPNDCISGFDVCLQTLNDNIINENSRDSLALFAELQLAKVKEISASEQCQVVIARAPIDPYYANAPIPQVQQDENKQQLKDCRDSYRAHTLAALRYSYAYLFYDELQAGDAQTPAPTAPTRPADIAANAPPRYLSKDLDIQTQDVYEAATNALIKQLYHERDHLDNLDNSVKVTQYSTTGLLDSTAARIAAQNQPQDSDHIRFGDDVKLLNITFTPPVNSGKKLDGNVNSHVNTNVNTNVDINIDVDVNSHISNNNNNSNSKKDGLEVRHKEPITDNEPVSIDLYLPNEPEYLQNAPGHNHRINGLYASHDLNFSGLNSVSQREGIGVSYVTLFEGRLDSSVIGLLKTKGRDFNESDPKKRIHLTGNVLVSGVVIPEGHTLQSVLDSHNFAIKLYNPHHTEAVDILGKPYYLAANFSASYGMWLAENGLDNLGYFTLLGKQQALLLPQLYMLEPYDPNKRIIIMLHGLASSPATWVRVTNDISNDETLRKNYQVWQVFYPTNIPILENRYQIQQLIETAYQQNDPNGVNPASKHSILIGHSMGGVIGRMLVSNDNLETKINALDKAAGNLQLSALIKNQINAQNIQNRLHLQKLAPVDEAIFISAPFRGTDFADRWFTRSLRRIIQLPLGFVQTITGNLANIATEGELTTNPLGALYLQNGASQLSDKSSFMQLTADLNIADGVTYHTIIAKQDSDLLQGLQQLKIATAPQTQLSTLPTTVKVATDANNTATLITAAKVPATFKNRSLARRSANYPTYLGRVTQDVEQALALDVSDGIVPYSSAHLDGAASESLLTGGHGIHEKSGAVLVLRKILHQHLKDYPIERNP